MTKFNPQGKDLLTYAESLEPAMQITDEADAAQYLAAYVEYIDKRLKHPAYGATTATTTAMTAEEIAGVNLGYYAGYYSPETRERVERLFHCKHPVFGAIKDNGPPTMAQALKAGFERGRK